MDRNTFWKNATEHYNGLKERGGLIPVEVPEWGGTLYYPATIPLLRRDRILKIHAEGGMKHMAQILIECARNEDGVAMFRQPDMDKILKEIDPDVLVRVAGVMVKAITPPDEDEIAKNYGATGTSGIDASSPTD